jgi:hypothetical protein
VVLARCGVVLVTVVGFVRVGHGEPVADHEAGSGGATASEDLQDTA